jgi:signal transduction histidine kinase
MVNDAHGSTQTSLASEARLNALLRGTSEAAQALLANDDFDAAMQAALAALGLALGFSGRVYIMKDIGLPTDKEIIYDCLYEWTSPGVVRCMGIPNRFPFKLKGFLDWPEKLWAGNSVWALAHELGAPARMLQKMDQALSLAAVPIMLEGRHWGVIGFDDCAEERIWSEAEITLLGTAAAIVAAAIQRRTSQQQLLAAEAARSQELAKANEVLQHTLAQLARSADLNAFLELVLMECARQSGATSNALFLYDDAHNTLRMTLFVKDDQLVDIATDERMTLWRTPLPADITDAWKKIRGDERLFAMSVSQPHPMAWPFSIAWHQQMGHRSVICVPLMLGEQAIGFMGLCFATQAGLDKVKQELARALAYQTTLAIELSRLSDETRRSAIIQERNRLAREVHDTLAQGFTGILVQMEAAEALVAHDQEKSRRHLKQARALARTSLLEARRTMWAIRPLDTDEGNLVDALEQLASRLCRDSLTYRIVCTGEALVLPAETHYEVLRIAQEAMINVSSNMPRLRPSPLSLNLPAPNFAWLSKMTAVAWIWTSNYATVQAWDSWLCRNALSASGLSSLSTLNLAGALACVSPCQFNDKPTHQTRLSKPL